MKLDLSKFTRRVIGEGPSIEHYYTSYREDDGESSLNIHLRHNQSLSKKWLNEMVPLLDIRVIPEDHKDNRYIRYLRRQHVD